MPTIRNIETVNLIAHNYCSNGHNKELALKDAGYSNSYAETLGHSKVYTNIRVKEAINGIEAEKRADGELKTEWLTQQRLLAVKKATELTNLTALDRHLQALEKHLGYYEKDNAQSRPVTAIAISAEQERACLLKRLARLEAAEAAPDARCEG